MNTNNKTILIVDDEKDVCTYLATLLQDNGFNVLIANNGKEGVDIAIKNNPDLISLDITMPEESGVKAFRELQDSELTKNTPVIIVTGVDNRFKEFIHTRNQVNPPAGYFEKPVKPVEFIKKVCELLGVEIPNSA
ncbi:response regulator [Bacteroidota bacterium]